MKAAALYYRVSKEDGGHSLEYQRRLLRQFAEKNDLASSGGLREFCDGGFSGTNLLRPGIQSFLEEARTGRISCLVIKDFSRFSRDYAVLGTYLEDIFPAWGVRVISINDRYDSSDNNSGFRNNFESSDARQSRLPWDMAFRTILYDAYSKDLSMKVRASMKTRCAKGVYIFGVTPFGYEKVLGCPGQIRICPEEAKTVCYLFALANRGLTAAQIARRLEEEGIATPGIQRGHKSGGWRSDTVSCILRNRFYLGEWAYGKTQVLEVGSHKTRPVPQKAWKVLAGHHAPLVTQDVFLKAQLPKKERNAKGREHMDGREVSIPKAVYPKPAFAGKVFCGGCGSRMGFKRESKRNRNRHWECMKVSRKKSNLCCSYFNEGLLENIVREAGSRSLLLWKEQRALEEGLRAAEVSAAKELRGELMKAAHRIERMNWRKEQEYLCWKKGEITPEAYQVRIKEWNKTQEALEQKLEAKRQVCLELTAGRLVKGWMPISKKGQLHPVKQKGIWEELTASVRLYRGRRLEICLSFDDPFGKRE